MFAEFPLPCPPHNQQDEGHHQAGENHMRYENRKVDRTSPVVIRVRYRPNLLMVAPMSGHYATLLRGTVREFMRDHNVYITDRDRRLVGVLPLGTLLLARKGTRVAEIMESDVVSVSAEVDQEDVAKLFMKYDLVALPVVDEDGLLIGRITVDDIMVLKKTPTQQRNTHSFVVALTHQAKRRSLKIVRLALPSRAIHNHDMDPAQRKVTDRA